VRSERKKSLRHRHFCDVMRKLDTMNIEQLARRRAVAIAEVRVVPMLQFVIVIGFESCGVY
jgi:hypothetical protein